MTLSNSQTYASSKSQKSIDKKKIMKGKYDDKYDKQNGNQTGHTFDNDAEKELYVLPKCLGCS